MAYSFFRSFAVDHTKVPGNLSNFPVLFSSICDTLNGAINNSVTSITTTYGKQIQNGDYIQIDSEKMLVSSGGGTTSLTVARAQLGSSAASHLTLAPVTNLFLATAANGGGLTSASGYDVIFTSDSAGTTPIPYERVVWNATQGMVEAWVLISPSSSSDTTVYIFWGNAAVTTDQSNPTAVWDSDFLLVAHFPDGSTLSVADSTTLNTGTNNGATVTSGKIDGAAAFNGLTQYVDYGNAVSGFTGDITLEAWINPSTTALGGIVGNIDGTNGYWIAQQVGGAFSQFIPFIEVANAGSGSFYVPSNFVTPPIIVGTWAQVIGRILSGAMSVWTNGVSAPAQANVGNGSIGSTTANLNVGQRPAALHSNYPGSLDEVRVSRIARSDNWIMTGFNTSDVPNSFYFLGVTGTPSAGGVVPQIMHHRRMQYAS